MEFGKSLNLGRVAIYNRTKFTNKTNGEEEEDRTDKVKVSFDEVERT